MMLQRTKADQVAGVYNEFFREYKSPEEILHSDKASIIKLLQPLGLNWRIENFIEVSKALVESHNGKVPDNREELKHLPGVGDYVAGIVLSLAFNKNEWVVDSNVVRIFKRYFGMQTTKEGRRDSHVITTAKLFSSESNAKEANLGLIDFGATICLPKKPKCNKCVLKYDCEYEKQDKFSYKK
jgi:A/G-specific adenine glycosylase